MVLCATCFVKNVSQDKGFAAAAAAAASYDDAAARCGSDRCMKESAGTRPYKCVIMFLVGACILDMVSSFVLQVCTTTHGLHAVVTASL